MRIEQARGFLGDHYDPRTRTLRLSRPASAAVADVGVAAHDELLAVELTRPVDSVDTIHRLSAQLPEGVHVTACQDLPGRKVPHAAWATFALPVASERRQALQQRLADLGAQPAWPCRRRSAKRGKPDRTLDLRHYAGELHLTAGRLTFRLTARDQVWARVEEVLARFADILREGLRRPLSCRP